MFTSVGPEPQWQVVYNRLITMEIDDVFTYTELQGMFPDMEFSLARAIFFQARKYVLRDRHRAFENVRNVGYKMVHPREQGRLATTHEKKARSQNNRALTLVTQVDHSMLTPAERKRISDLEMHYRNIRRFLKQLSSRQERLEQRVSVTEKDHGKLIDRVDETQNEVIERLNRLEARLERLNLLEGKLKEHGFTNGTTSE